MKTSMHKTPFRVLPVLVALIAAYPVLAEADSGRFQFVYGDVRIIDGQGHERTASKGGEINEGETVTTAASASAQLRMNDGGFLALRPGTSLRVDTYRYAGKEDGSEKSLLSLFKGGFRAITGLIGHTNKDNYQIRTPSATIGIRGTDHEPMVILPAQPGETPLGPPGTYDKVNKGQAFIKTDKGIANINPNQVGHAAKTGATPVILTKIPDFYKATPETQKQTEKTSSSNKSDSPGDKQAKTTATSSGDTAKDTKSSSASEEKTEATKSTSAAATTKESGGTTSTTATTAGSSSDSAATTTGSTPAATTASTTTAVSSGSEPVRTAVSSDTSLLAGTSTAVTTTMTTASNTVTTGSTSTSASTTTTAATTITGTDSSGNLVNTTTQTVTSSTGTTAPITTATTISVPPSRSYVALSYQPYSSSVNDAKASTVTLDLSGNLTGFTSRYDFGNTVGGNVMTGAGTTLAVGAGATTAKAGSYATTGIEYGSWQGGTVSYTPYSYITPAGTNFAWMGAQAGYWDSAAYPAALTGTYVYSMDGPGIAPRDLNGNVGTLNNLSMGVNFSTQSISSLALSATINSKTWSASNTAPLGIYTNGVYGSANNAFDAWSGSNLTVTKTGSSGTVGGNVNGVFTGQNFSGAMVNYSFWEQDANWNYLDAVGGVGVVKRDTAITNGAAISGGPYALALVSNTRDSRVSSYITSANSLSVDGSGNPVGFQNAYTDTYYSGANISQNWGATYSGTSSTTGTSSTGIKYGIWADGGTLNFSSGTSLGNTSLSWIMGPAPASGYLSQVLTGSASYNLDGNTAPTDLAGHAGTLNSATLNANFTTQTVGASLNATVNSKTWIATATNVPMHDNGFDAWGCSGCTAGNSMTVSYNGGTNNGWGNLNGSFTGNDLSGALLSYRFQADTGSGPDSINGVAAFVGAPVNANTAYRPVLIAGYDPASGMPVVDGAYNAVSGVTGVGVSLDGSGNLTAFDNHLSNNFSHLSMGTATLANTGSDATTGIVWGRWDGGSLAQTARGTTSPVTNLTNAGSLHYIAGPELTAPVALPQTGTFTYTQVGGTIPTALNVGTANPGASVGSSVATSTLTANFTNQTVSASVNASVGATTLAATATNMPIMDGAHFGAGNGAGNWNPTPLTVACTGTCGTSNSGVLQGAFVGSTGQGAGIGYALNTTNNGTINNTISGVAAFKR